LLVFCVRAPGLFDNFFFFKKKEIFYQTKPKNLKQNM